jgi:hypothetical protein
MTSEQSGIEAICVAAISEDNPTLGAAVQVCLRTIIG